jgi:hypothetical protein
MGHPAVVEGIERKSAFFPVGIHCPEKPRSQKRDRGHPPILVAFGVCIHLPGDCGGDSAEKRVHSDDYSLLFAGPALSVGARPVLAVVGG